MHDELGNEGEEEVLDEAHGEGEVGPVVAVLEDLEAVAVELDVAVKVHLVEEVHLDLDIAAVLGLVLGVLEGQVELNRTAGELGLFVLARANGRDDEPPANKDGQVEDDGEENGRLPASANLPGEVGGDEHEEADEDVGMEAFSTGAIGRQRGVVDGGRLEQELAIDCMLVNGGRGGQNVHRSERHRSLQPRSWQEPEEASG